MKLALKSLSIPTAIGQKLGIAAVLWVGLLAVVALFSFAVKAQLATLGQVRAQSLLIVPNSARVNFGGLNTIVDKIQQGSTFVPEEGPQSPFGLPPSRTN